MRVQEKNNKGFNILEIVVVLALVAIITGIAIPNFSSWNKERKTKSAAQKMATLISNITSQVQRGKYGFVQFRVEDSTLGTADQVYVIVTTNGMKMNTLMSMVNDGDHVWNSDTGNTTWCDINNNTYWNDIGSANSDVPEVGYSRFKDIAVNFKRTVGAVCFSTEGTWYSGAGSFVSGADADISVDPVMFVCRRRNIDTVCEISETDGIPTVDTIKNNEPIFAINWTRFGNVTLEKWSSKKNEWILQ